MGHSRAREDGEAEPLMNDRWVGVAPFFFFIDRRHQ